VITPRLFRRALRRSLQWRLLLLWWASLVLPSVIAAVPVFAFLRRQLDHAPEAARSVAFVDGATLIELVRQLDENGVSTSIGFASVAAALLVMAISPFVAAATLAAARADEPPGLGRLLAGAGELYGRMLRTLLAGLLPVGLGAGLAAGALRLAVRATERSVTEGAANRALILGTCAGALAFFVCHLTVDAARAQFAAGPGRRSAVLALWAGIRLLIRRPLRAAALGGLGALLGVGGALGLMALRLRIVQAGPASIGLAWLLAQAAHLLVGWGRAARIFGLAELAQADAADRERSGFRMEPPAGSPTPAQVIHSTTLSALEPPRSGASR
jgi:hypothetical protein